jgi:anti-sigma B factor antagonist
LSDTTPFHCDLEHDGDGTARVRPSGELDMAAASVLEARMDEAREAGATRLVVDLRGLRFMDSTGLTLLTRWSLAAERDGYALALLPGPPQVHRLFELTRLERHFTFLDAQEGRDDAR